MGGNNVTRYSAMDLHIVLFIALSIKFYKIETKLDLLKDQIRALKGEIPEESVGKW